MSGFTKRKPGSLEVKLRVMRARALLSVKGNMPATLEEVRNNYKVLVRQLHPDASPNPAIGLSATRLGKCFAVDFDMLQQAKDFLIEHLEAQDEK